MSGWYLSDAAAGIARRSAALETARIDRLSVKEQRQLVGDTEVRSTPAALVQKAHDIPFVVRAVAEGDGRAQPVLIAKAGLVDLACSTAFLKSGSLATRLSKKSLSFPR